MPVTSECRNAQMILTEFTTLFSLANLILARRSFAQSVYGWGAGRSERKDFPAMWLPLAAEPTLAMAMLRSVSLLTKLN